LPRFTAESERKPLTAQVKDFQGVPTLFINSKPENFMLYALISGTQRHTHHIPSFRDAEIHFYKVPLNFGECFTVDGQTDFSFVETCLTELL